MAFGNNIGIKLRRLALTSASDTDWQSLAQQSSYKVSSLAKLLDLSVRQTERLVQRRFAKPAREYLLRERMQKAQTLLYRADSIKQVSIDLRYSNPSLFSRHFKSIYGISPTAYLYQKAKECRI